MTQVHMMCEAGMYHLHFWCDLYSPHRIWYPKEEYCKGEEICKGCGILDEGVMYRASFQCTREATPTYLSRFDVPRGSGGFFNSHPADIPMKEQKKIADLFGWLYGREIKAKRKHAKKVIEASEERTDIHGAEGGTPTGLVHENPVGKELGEPEAPTGSSEVKSRFELTFGSIPPIADGVPKVSEGAVRNNDPPLHGAIPYPQMSEMRSTDNVQDNRKPVVACVRAVFEPAMKEEYDASYKETTAHACITCKCGKKVWYGCAKRHLTRPKYCDTCTRTEAVKITSRYEGSVDAAELQRIMDWELRRVITR